MYDGCFSLGYKPLWKRGTPLLGVCLQNSGACLKWTLDELDRLEMNTDTSD